MYTRVLHILLEYIYIYIMYEYTLILCTCYLFYSFNNMMRKKNV